MRFLLVAALASASPALAAEPLPPHNWMTPADRTESGGRVAYYKGNDLHELCKDFPTECRIYVQGVVDGQLAAVMATSRDVAYCIPEASTPDQVKDVVFRYLEEHPERRHQMAGSLIANALSDAWPQCK